MWLDRETKPERVESGSDANRFLHVLKWYDTQHTVGGSRCDFIRLRLQQHPIMPPRTNPSPEKEEQTRGRAEELSSFQR